MYSCIPEPFLVIPVQYLGEIFLYLSCKSLDVIWQSDYIFMSHFLHIQPIHWNLHKTVHEHFTTLQKSSHGIHVCIIYSIAANYYKIEIKLPQDNLHVHVHIRMRTYTYIEKVTKRYTRTYVHNIYKFCTFMNI